MRSYTRRFRAWGRRLAGLNTASPYILHGNNVCTGPGVSPSLSVQDAFKGISWQYILDAVAEFEQFQVKTKQGRRAFISILGKPYSEASLRRWQTQWLPLISRKDKKGNLVMREGAHLFPCNPKGVRSLSTYKA